MGAHDLVVAFPFHFAQDEIVQRVTQLEKLASETRSTNETLQGRVDKLSNDVQALEMENMSLRLKIANLEQHDVLAELPTFRFKSAHSQSSNGEVGTRNALGLNVYAH